MDKFPGPWPLRRRRAILVLWRKVYLMRTPSLREQVIQQIKKLSESDLREVLDFVESLPTKQRSPFPSEIAEALDPRQDPLLQYIGDVVHGSLAREIDEELYDR